MSAGGPGASKKHFRGKPRAGLRVDVTYQRLGADGAPAGPESARACTSNIGVGGAFIATAHPLPAGTQLLVAVTLPTGTKVAPLRADVRWVLDGPHDPVRGMGVRFHSLQPEQARLLREYFAQLPPTLDHDELT